MEWLILKMNVIDTVSSIPFMMTGYRENQTFKVSLVEEDDTVLNMMVFMFDDRCFWRGTCDTAG